MDVRSIKRRQMYNLRCKLIDKHGCMWSIKHLFGMIVIGYLTFFLFHLTVYSILQDANRNKIKDGDLLLHWNANVIGGMSRLSLFNRSISDEFGKTIGNQTPSKQPNVLDKSRYDRCLVKIATIDEIDYNNIYWQRFVSSNGTYFLYNAYYDNRPLAGPLPMVRIVAMIDRLSPPAIICQLWFKNIRFPVTMVPTYEYIWRSQWGNYRDGILQPFIITCRLSSKNNMTLRTLVPQSVSLVINECDNATNNLLINNNRRLSKREQFVVCVKGLDYPHIDISIRLIEWIELLNLLGVEKIFFYEFTVHPNVIQVLEYYRQKQIVERISISLPGSQPNLPEMRHQYLKNQIVHKRQNELIPYNDCLYQNLYFYDYVVLLDIDEIIIPLVHQNWSQLISQIRNISDGKTNSSFASYALQNIYFWNNFTDQLNIPSYMYMLKHIYRSNKYTPLNHYVKSFFDTKRVVAIHNHHPLHCFGPCLKYSISTHLAHLQHYRQECVSSLQKSCQTVYGVHIILDTNIWKYKNILINKTSYTINQLHFKVS